MAKRKFYRAKRRSTKKRRRFRRRSFLRTKGPGLVRSSPLPKKFKYQTKYVETQVNLDPGVGGTTATHVFSLNSLYDPDVTGAGHQPIGFDQLMPLYDHYTVIGARVRVTASNTDPTNSQTLILSLRDNATVSNDLPQIIENGMCRYGHLAPSVGGMSSKTLSLNCSMKKFFGKNILSDDIYRGDISSNPTEQVYLHITVGPTAAVDCAPVRCTVEIQFIAMLTEPKLLTQS